MKNVVIYSKNVVKYTTIAATVHTTLPKSTASQGVSFALYRLHFLLNLTFIYNKKLFTPTQHVKH